jgi:hypothetical protein
MDKDSILNEIFSNDPFGILTIKPSASPARNEEERLLASFQEINEFYEKNKREPNQTSGIQEHQLYTRLKGLRENQNKIEIIKSSDRFGLLSIIPKEINSLEDIFDNDALGLLEDDSESIFTLKHIKKQDERASTDFVAKRKVCKDFTKYEELFKNCQNDLKNKKRKLLNFTQENLREKEFYVHNGVLLFLELIKEQKEVQNFNSGKRIRKDGRTHIIFENGTESNMLYRSLYKILLVNGQTVSENADKVNEIFAEKFTNITDEDKAVGFIYILKSKSTKREIKEIQNLYKIGYSTVAVEERIKNASQEPTYLMADVHIVMTYKCFNMNPQKLEQLLHNFFGTACLNLDVFDGAGNRHTPREWFIAPLHIIEKATHLILNSEILKYRYDSIKEEILEKEFTVLQ